MENEVIQNEVEQNQEQVVEEQSQDEHIDAGDQSENQKDADEDPVKAAERRAGKAIAAQRREYQEKLQRLARENELLRNSQSGQSSSAEQEEGLIYDPKTGRTFRIDTPLGLAVWREQEAARFQQKSEQEAVYQETAEKVMSGSALYDDFDNALATFKRHGTDHIADALISVEDPAAVVYHLGSNLEELNRLAKMKPHEARRAVYKLESALNGTSKKVSSAPSPVKPVSEVRNVNRAVEDQSLSEREAYYRKKYSR